MNLQTLRDYGYFLLPLPAKAKAPPPKNWINAKEPYKIKSGQNIAIGIRGKIAILITNDEPSTVWATEQYGTPNVLSKRGAHWYFKSREGMVNEANVRTSVGVMEYHVRNKYALIPPSIHPSGLKYEWGKDLLKISELPEAPDLKDLFHPGGTHHAELLKMSAAKAHNGAEADTISKELKKYVTEHFPDPDAHPDKEMEEMAKSAFEKFHDEKKKKNIEEQKDEEEQKDNEENIKDYEGPGGGWLPFSLTNDQPTAWAGWIEGQPYMKQLRMKKGGGFNINDKKITLREYDGMPIKDMIKRIKGEKEEDLFLFKNEIFTKPDFVSEMVYPGNVNVFTECLNALTMSTEIYREPKFYFEDGHIRFPDLCYAKRDDAYQKILKDAFNIGPVDMETYNAGIGMLKRYPKQLTLHYSLYGANIANVLGVNDYPITIDAVGDSDAGKSFAIVLALKLGYGIGAAILQDDAMNSAFRHHAISNSTNLPIYTEEAKITDKSKLKSRAKNLRGNADKSMNSYDIITTWILSRNTDLLNEELDPIEKKAEDKRIYRYNFEEEDIVPKELFNVGKRYLKKINNMPFGLLYEKLKLKTIEEITEKYYSLMDSETDGRKVVALLGAWLMDDAEFIPVVSEFKAPTIEGEFITKVLSIHRRLELKLNINATNGYDHITTNEDKSLVNQVFVDEKEGIFKITTVAFNVIKKELNIKLSAAKFAAAHGYHYDLVTIEHKRNKGFKGKIPKDFKKEEENIDKFIGGVDNYEVDEDKDNTNYQYENSIDRLLED